MSGGAEEHNAGYEISPCALAKQKTFAGAVQIRCDHFVKEK